MEVVSISKYWVFTLDLKKNRGSLPTERKIKRLCVCVTNHVDPIYSPPSPISETERIKSVLILQTPIN